jgi:protein SCO1/2
VALLVFGGCEPPRGGSGSTEGRARSAEVSPSSGVSLFRYPWVWNDEHGSSVTFARWRGEPLVVSVFFTSCRKTCPRTLQTLRTVQANFSREHRAAQFVLVTLDPTNDTPDTLREFKTTERLPDAWHLLTGSAPQTRDLADLLDIHVMDLDPHVVHEGKIVIFDSQGMRVQSFSSSGAEADAL